MCSNEQSFLKDLKNVAALVDRVRFSYYLDHQNICVVIVLIVHTGEAV